MARYWLCPRGTEEKPLPANWFELDSWRREHTMGYGTGIQGTPGIKTGDQIVWYAVGRRVLFGLAEVTADPEQRQVREWQGDRWPWYIATRTHLCVRDLTEGPTLNDAGLDWSEPVRSYRKLTEAEFEACSRLLKRFGEPFDEP